MNANPAMKPKDSRTDRLLRLAIACGILVYALGFVAALLEPAFGRLFGAPRLAITEYIVLMPPPGESATASWSEGSGELPLLFRYGPLPTGSWFSVRRFVKVEDSKGNVLTAHGPCPGFKSEGTMEVVPQPPPRWYEFLKKVKQRRTIYANSFLVYRYDLPNAHPLPGPNDRNRVKTEDALPMPEAFIVPKTRDRFVEDVIRQKAAEIGIGEQE